MTHTPTPEGLAIGQRAYAALSTAVELKWFNAAPRVHGWEATLVQAYAALADDSGDDLVDLPANGWEGEDVLQDPASRVLEAFDNWLGHNVVQDAFDMVQSDEDVDLGYATVSQGVALAMRNGW